MQHLEFDINGDFIELSKLLKATGVCESGGAAKMLVSSGEVAVDGVVELRKGAKIRAGQTVQTSGMRVTIRAAASNP